MADNERTYAEHAEYIIGEGGLTKDAVKLGDKGIVALNVAANYKTWQGEEGVHYREIIVRRPWSTAAAEYTKGTRITYAGKVEGNKYTDKDGVERHNVKIIADQIGLSSKFAGYNKGKSSSKPAQKAQDDTPPFDVDNNSGGGDDDGLDLDSLL